MEQIMALLQTVVPILVCIGLGFFARKKELLTTEQTGGIQQFVLKFCIPPVLFNSCLEAKIGAENLTTMVMLLPVLLLSSLWAFHARKKRYPYHNFPMLFAAHETGMIGLPLCIILFGASEAYRMGILDMTQGLISIPVMVILASDTVVLSPDGEILGKPRDRADAERMLRALSGRRHRVISGVAVLRGEVLVTDHEVTEVCFARLSDSTIERYLATNEPYDKAGAYGIQDTAALWIEGIHGDYFNVVGLPVYRLETMLQAEFGLSLWKPE